MYHISEYISTGFNVSAKTANDLIWFVAAWLLIRL